MLFFSRQRLHIKAEFDAALSDFNARLTTFEAGINSKIDSQVSSYLDRNGIWNGKNQTLASSVFDVIWRNNTTAGTEDNARVLILRMNMTTKRIQDKDATTSWLAPYTYVQTDSRGMTELILKDSAMNNTRMLVTELNKSGLLRLDYTYSWTWKPVGGSWAWCIAEEKASTYTYAPYVHLALTGNLMTKLSTAANVEANWSPQLGFDTHFDKTYTMWMPCIFDTGDANNTGTSAVVYAFVNKGDSLGLKLKSEIKHNLLYQQGSSTQHASKDMFTYKISVQKAQIY